MKKGSEETGLDVGKCLDRGKYSVCASVKKNPILLHQWLSGANRAELWRMITIFRGTDLWDDFLRSLLTMSQEDWVKNKLLINKSSFEAKEVEQIIRIYEGMGTDVKIREILFDLDYDGYWTRQVQKAAQKGRRAAQAELHKAREGLNLGGIPTQASKKCLAELTAYLRSLKKQKNKK